MEISPTWSGVTMSVEVAGPERDAVDGEIPRFARVAVARAMASASRGTRSDRELRASVAPLCDAARRHGLQAETVLLVVKDCWRNLADDRLIERHLAGAALETLVTMCIVEFYK